MERFQIGYWFSTLPHAPDARFPVYECHRSLGPKSVGRTVALAAMAKVGSVRHGGKRLGLFRIERALDDTRRRVEAVAQDQFRRRALLFRDNHLAHLVLQTDPAPADFLLRVQGVVLQEGAQSG